MKKIFENLLKSYCTTEKQEAGPLKLPHLIFLPPSFDDSIVDIIQSTLPHDIASSWLVYPTGNSFTNSGMLQPILELIRELLFIDPDLVQQNAELPEEDQLQQIGSYLIPDNLADIPNISLFYQVLAEEISEEEQMILFNPDADKTLPSPSIQSEVHPNSDNSALENPISLNPTALIVFRRIILDLFKLEGLILIFEDFEGPNPNDIRWLELLMNQQFSENTPILFIIKPNKQTSISNIRDTIQNWQNLEHVFCIFDTNTQDLVNMPNDPLEAKSLKNTMLHTKTVPKNDPAMKLLSSSQSLYTFLHSIENLP